MKLHLTINLDDTYTRDDETIQEHIMRRVKQEVIDKIRSDFSEKAAIEISKMVDKKSGELITQRSKEYLENEEIEFDVSDSHYSKDIKKMTFGDYLIHKISHQNGANKIVSEIAKSFVEGLKQRYDLQFASRIVEKMTQHKLVDEKVANLLSDQS